MTRDDLLALVAAVRTRRDETTEVEVKEARGGTPKLFEALSAFANRPGGGVILLGLEEKGGFAVCGVGNVQQVQADISGVAANDMEPALRPMFTVEEVEGRPVVAVEVSEVPADQKPCYHKKYGPHGGAYLRVGNSNRTMTDYEVFSYMSNRGQPRDDEMPAPGATVAHLDGEAVDAFLAGLRKTRPRASYLDGPPEQALGTLKVVQVVEGVSRPTVAGLLVFGRYPQEFFPQLVVTFVHYFGTDESERTPAGERFLDNRRFEGPLPALAEEAINYVLASVRKSATIQGVRRQDSPEYPLEAVREAVLNALVHRDYSPRAVGSQVQIKLFADRLVVESPGGLYGTVTEEDIEDGESTRNAVLMRMCEELHLAENRGSGVNDMIRAMRDAHLEPPRFEDRRTAFRVTFRNHSLLDPESLAWVGQFRAADLNDRQRLALVYLRHNEKLTNAEYRRLNRVDPLVAGRELRALVAAGLTEQLSANRWSYYSLKVPKEVTQAAVDEESRILGYVRQHGSIRNSDCQQLLGVGDERARYLLKKLTAAKQLLAVGQGRWRRYILPVDRYQESSRADSG